MTEAGYEVCEIGFAVEQRDSVDGRVVDGSYRSSRFRFDCYCGGKRISPGTATDGNFNPRESASSEFTKRESASVDGESNLT